MAKNTQKKMDYQKPLKNKRPPKDLPTDLFLVEFMDLALYARTTIPPTTIARHSFFSRLSSDYYKQFTEEQRAYMLDLITGEMHFDIKDPDCRHFYDRYAKGNQYIVHVLNAKGSVEVFETYLHNGKYHLTSHSSLLEKNIVKVTEKYDPTENI